MDVPISGVRIESGVEIRGSYGELMGTVMRQQVSSRAAAIVIPSGRDCHPEHPRGIFSNVIVANLATSTSQEIPHLPAARAPALGMTAPLVPPRARVISGGRVPLHVRPHLPNKLRPRHRV